MTSRSCGRSSGTPTELVAGKVADRLNHLTRQFIERSPFLCVATARPDGGLDVSPRGDPAGFARILDERTLLLPERPGNRLADTLTNLLADDRIALLFLIPGVGDSFRVNGRAVVTDDAELLAASAIDGRPPRLGILVTIDEAYTQCSKALIRSDLWNPENHVDRDELPSGGEILRAVSDPQLDAQEYDRERAGRYSAAKASTRRGARAPESRRTAPDSLFESGSRVSRRARQAETLHPERLRAAKRCLTPLVSDTSAPAARVFGNDPEACVSSVPLVRKILVTGMSGTGKSTALVELSRQGFDVIETDVGGWSEWSEPDGGYVWREDRIRELLAREHGPTVYVSGTVSNQGRFYPQFDAVVLLSAPADVLLRRIVSRTTNEFGRDDQEREAILRDLAEVEPLLRETCTHEIDATQPIAVVVEQLVTIGTAAER